ncbi:MAG: hypothetical protein H6625_12640 [Bdellovibrionaceae bacterium]|nr:hypothetical protein [Pseudobdellovibrionaceae bacterium]
MKKNKSIVFAGMGFELAGLIIGGLFFGQHLDKSYNLKGLATAGITFAVLLSWLVHLVFLLKKYQEPDTETIIDKNDA